jgi:hypothetical protein
VCGPASGGAVRVSWRLFANAVTSITSTVARPWQIALRRVDSSSHEIAALQAPGRGRATHRRSGASYASNVPPVSRMMPGEGSRSRGMPLRPRPPYHLLEPTRSGPLPSANAVILVTSGAARLWQPIRWRAEVRSITFSVLRGPGRSTQQPATGATILRSQASHGLPSLDL